MLQDKEVPTRRAKKARKEVLTQDCYKKTATLGLFCSLTAIGKTQRVAVTLSKIMHTYAEKCLARQPLFVWNGHYLVYLRDNGFVFAALCAIVVSIESGVYIVVQGW